MRAAMAMILATTIVADAHAFATPPARRLPPMHLAVLGSWKLVPERPGCDDATAVIEPKRIVGHVGSRDETFEYEIVREEVNVLYFELLLPSRRQPVEVDRDAASNELSYEVVGIRSRLVPLP